MVASKAASVLGRTVSNRMRPIDDRDQIIRSLEETSEMVRILQERGRFPLAGLCDVEERMRAAKEGGQPLEPKDLRDFAATLETAGEIRKLMGPLRNEYPRLRELATRLQDFPEIRREIERAIDPKGKVSDDATVSLKKIRAEIRSLTTRIHGRLEIVLNSPSVGKHLQDRRISLRGGRYVLAVKSGARGQVEGILHDRSQTGATIFVEPKQIVELGNSLTEALVDEAQEVSRILWEITRQIYANAKDVIRTLETLAWIDFTYAKAKYGIEFDLRAPVMGEALDLRGVKHPILMELLGKDTVVPISIRLTGDDRILVITGPNNGGKTVALKAIGLLVVMAHAGLHIPCLRDSSMPFYPVLFADIGDEQSLETHLSTYSSHMARVVTILKDAPEGSLILIDELGSGTDPSEGAALGEAILSRLLRRKTHVLVSTHLGSLKEFAFREGGVANAAVEFDPDTLEPLYRITIGAPGNSQALAIARRLGIPEEVAKEAEKRLGSEGQDGRELVERIQKVRLLTEKGRDDVLKLEEAAREEEKKARQMLTEASALKKSIVRESDDQMEKTYRTIKKLLEDYEGEMQGAPRKQAERAQALREAVREVLTHTPFGEKRQAFASGLKKGKRVFVIKFGREGQVSRVNRNKERLTIQLGRVVVETGFDDVSWVNEQGRPVGG